MDKEKCDKALYLDLSEYIDHYSFHDTQTLFTFYCDKEKDHKGLHQVLIKGYNSIIYWDRNDK